MKDLYIHVFSILLVVAGMIFITFIYASEPKSIAEVATKGSVAIGTYQIDQTEVARGVELFHRDSFSAARSAFDRADPEKRDASVQFYIAYSFYRQGWGRFSNDDALFTSALAVVGRVDSINPTFTTSDPSLQIKTATELRSELEEGLKITPSDFNPLKLARERK